MSMVSWFDRVCGVNGFMVLLVSWCQGFHSFMCFGVFMVLWFHRFRGVKGFMVL